MRDMERITLAQALAEDRIYDFVEQAEREGVGNADEAQFMRLMGLVVRETQPEGQTSRSPAHGSKRGK